MLGLLVDGRTDVENQVGGRQTKQQIRKCITAKLPLKVEGSELVIGAEGVHARIAHGAPVDTELCGVLAFDPGNVIRVLEGSRMRGAHVAMSDPAETRSRTEIEAWEAAIVSGMGKIETGYPQVRHHRCAREGKRLVESQIAVAKTEFVDQARGEGIAVGDQKVPVLLRVSDRR